jgi:polar amino acid transport system substrate-binding protein
MAALLVLCLAPGAVLAQASPSPSPGAPEPDGHLARILQAGRIVMSTDPQYPPQSELLPDGSYQGFDIDVGTEIASRLGVEVAFETPAWDVITAGSWGGRWDFSVGSMTITTSREEILDFTRPYYFTPAQMAARADLGYESLDDLAGRTVCVGRGTTYLDWFNGTLDLGSAVALPEPPEGSVVTTLSTDRLCAEAPT